MLPGPGGRVNSPPREVRERGRRTWADVPSRELEFALRTSALLAALLLAPTPAPAQTADWHPPTVGTTFEWRINGTETVSARVTAVTDFLVTEETGAGGQRSRYFDFVMPEASTGELAVIDPTPLKYFWPLEIGKTAEFRTTSGPLASSQTLTVSGYEQQTAVPAGTFETFIIDWDQRGLGSNRFLDHMRVWYAPALGTYVRFERELTLAAGGSGKTSGELVAVQPP